MHHIVSCNIKGNIAEQLFQIANIYNYSIKYNTEMILCDSENINQDIKIIIKNKIKIIPVNEFNIIHFNMHLEDKNNKTEIPYNNNNLYIIGSFINNNFYTENTRQFISDLLNNNEYHKEAINIFKNIKNYFNDNDNDNDKYIIIIMKKPDYNDTDNIDIIYYNIAYEMLNGKDKNIIILTSDYEWCKNQYSINKNFYFVENDNKCIHLILMQFVSYIICNNSYLAWWGAYLNNKNNNKIIMPNKNYYINNNIKLNNFIYIE